MKLSCLAIAIAFALFPGAGYASADDAAPSSVHNVAEGTKPRIAADANGHLHAVFEGYLEGSKIPDVFYSESSDQGKTWTAPKDISTTPGISTHPDIAVEKSGAIDVVWSDTSADVKSPDIFFTRSVDGGDSWSPFTDISNTPGASTEPAIAVGPDNSIHAVWCDTSKGETNPDIYYTSSADGGKTWAKNPLLPAEDISNTKGVSSEPAIAVANDDVVHVVWLDNTPGEKNPDIYYAKSSDDSWSKAVDISNTPKMSSHPGIACGANGKVYVVWCDASFKKNAPDIYCVITDKNGKFGQPINISDTPGVSGEPVIAADGQDRIVIAWADTSKEANKPHVFARISIDGGKQFSNVMDLGTPLGPAKCPEVTIVGDKLFAIWQEAQGDKSKLNLTSLGLKGVATGVVLQAH